MTVWRNFRDRGLKVFKNGPPCLMNSETLTYINLGRGSKKKYPLILTLVRKRKCT